MKTRILVAVIAIPILLAVIFFTPAWALGIVVGAIAACCAWEFLRCTDQNMKRRFQIYAAVSAFCIPLGSALLAADIVYEVFLFALFAVIFCELMHSFRDETTIRLETVMLVLFAGGILPILLAAIVRLGVREHGSVYALLPFVVAFSSDSGAYFAGSFLGRHQLTPKLSPHKTIEGSIGGFVAAIVCMMIYGLVLMGAKYEVQLLIVAVYGFLGSLACQLGDLSFSAVKRLCGVKDYGDLIPGHGGMLDRFDSMFWTAALVELLVKWVPAVTK